MSRLLLSALVLTAAASAAEAPVRVNNPSSAERFAKPSDALVEREDTFWKRTPLRVPDDIVLETSGIVAVPGKRLLVTTRRGEIWWIDGAYDADPKPKFTLFASGLHEPLGIIAAPKGGYYVAQRQEITRLEDTDGDGRADRFETVAKLPISGSYHEYAFGPVLAPNGNLRVTLNVAFGGATQAPAPWRGWMLEVTPDGQIIPVAAGLRSPCGVMVTSKGEWFFSENQGEWIGSGRITHVTPGDFTGHPAGLAWSRQPGSTVKLRPDDIKDFEEPMADVAKRVPGLKPPAVWLPHTVLGISNAGMLEDLTGGKFGPFANQLFVADQGQSKVVRVALEQVKGVWQGVAIPFREGFECGIIRISHGEDGVMFAGESARGWGSVGAKQFGLERLAWTGRTPLEIKTVQAQPDGFTLTFTKPVDRAVAEKPETYSVAGFTYLYHKAYGSAPVNRLACPVRKVVVAADGLSARLALSCLREGYIHEIKAAGLRAADGNEAILHPTAYYTMNRIPDGARIIPPDPKEVELCAPTAAPAAVANTKKHPIKVPSDWAGDEGDKTILLGTQPGLQFDTTLLTAKAGSRLRLVFRNADDMLHNFVLCAPGRGQTVGAAAMALGLDGAAKSYVPDSDDVLYHTSLVQPGTSDTIFINVPSAPGDYDFVCTFPGHSVLMKGILRVE
ncbi:plastocyanin/azurin family copper-binding protein [Horticoccus sp. 23ND18S-11]|uniref:plastocyanin/azurin family copper-binding protein n=1 Tax=Horticoccus sp. 23ND18S-11 TaxID=3391832 RepID=UPI0039C91184